MTRHLLCVLFLTMLTCTANANSNGYISHPSNFNNYTISHTRNTLPERFDSREQSWLLDPRSQQITGPCWAFAVADAVQAYFYKSGFEEGYLSPEILTNCHDGFVFTKSQGGNSYIATACFSRLIGPAYEDAVPYSPLSTECPAHSVDDYPAYVLGAIILPKNDTIAIKQAIYDHGSVTAAIYFANPYYNGDDYSYCYTGTEKPNHGISIVGWDDTERKFIVKNTYGTNSYDEGYFYVSYDDVNIISECFAFEKRVEKSAIDTVYGYDKTGMISKYTYAYKTVSTITRFEAPEKQILNSVGFYIPNPNMKIVIGVLSAEEIIYQSDSLPYTYPGFYTFDLPENTFVENDFYVAIDYPYSIPVENAVENYNDPVIKPIGYQYIQFNNESAWYDVGVGSQTPSLSNINFCTKAYTRKFTVETPKEAATEDLYVVLEGRINPNIWKDANNIEIYSNAGKLVEIIKKDTEYTYSGFCVLVVHYNDGTTKSVKAILK
ncbi:MAG: hypothetical protein KBA02_02795 [Paludibacteraceae bacterium]|nr:hypothetical protein [Paludibacteraceae bacterium]